MKYKTIFLVILAILFLFIVLNAFFVAFSTKILEGIDDTNTNPNVIAAKKYLQFRDNKHNNGISNKTILDNIGRLPSFGDDNLNSQIKSILFSTDSDSVKIDKLDALFGVPLYDSLKDGLAVHYDFKDQPIKNQDNEYFIVNKSPNGFYNNPPETYDTRIVGNQDITTIISSKDPIVFDKSKNGNYLNLIGTGECRENPNGGYLVSNASPTGYDEDHNFLGMSFSVWFNANANSGHYSRIFDFGNGLNAPPEQMNNIFITVNKNSNHLLGFYMHNDMGNHSWKEFTLNNINVLNNKWIHIVWSISDKGEWTIYLNNEKVNENEFVMKPRNIQRRINYIGYSHWWWDHMYNGKMSDFRMYVRELLPDDVNALYNLGNVTNPNFIRKSTNLIRNGLFTYPRLRSFHENVSAKEWESTRNTLVINVVHGGYSYGIGMNPDLGYATQLGLISNFGTNFKNGYLKQKNIGMVPNVTYELSFLHSLYVHSSRQDNVFLYVKLGCYIDINKKEIIPKGNTWQRFSITFTTDSNCTEETLTITLESPRENNVDTTCAISNVSLRKV